MRFEDFAREHGLILHYAVQDGRYHRVPTLDHPHKRNGAYAIIGLAGAVRNFATMDAFAVWKPGREAPADAAAIKARLLEAQEDERKRHAAAAIEAQALLDACSRLRHTYLARKGFPTMLGFVHPDGDLIVPMRGLANNALNSVQRIAADGKKLFLTGGKARGSVLRLGGVRGPWWLVEGYATGLSVQAAAADLRQDCRIVCCFSAGNIIYVASQLSGPLFCFADHDESGTGQRAAEATGRPYCMWSELGDANDLHMAVGLRKVCGLMLDAQNA